jgi:glyoxylase I family protein
MVHYNNHHVSVNVTDLDKSIRFYKILGFEERHRYADDSVIIVHLLSKTLLIELFNYSNAKPTRSKFSDVEHKDIIGIEHFSLQVDDIQEAFKELEPFSVCEISKGRTGIDYFFIVDPDGNRIEIVKDIRQLLS